MAHKLFSVLNKDNKQYTRLAIRSQLAPLNSVVGQLRECVGVAVS